MRHAAVVFFSATLIALVTACGGGGGGRIAVDLTSGTSFDNVSMLAYGTTNGTYYGAAGTVYMETAPQGTGGGVLAANEDH